MSTSSIAKMDDFPSSDDEEAEKGTTGGVGAVAADGLVNVAVAAVNSDVAAVNSDEPPPQPAASTNTTALTPVTLQHTLTNTAYHVDRERWFDLLQDDGTEMTGEEKTKYSTPVKGKRNNKHYNIAHAGRFYPKLYSLAQICVQKMKEHPDAYPRLNHSSKNLSSFIHPIGRHIASTRKRFARADLHNMGRDIGSSDFIQSDTYENRDCFYIFSQQLMLEYLFDKYGPEKENKRPTIDDFVRVTCLLFDKDDMRSYITSMVGTAKSDNRQELDAAPARNKAGFRLLHTRFIDQEEIVALPDMWTRDETRAAIEKKYGPGSFETYCTVNQNNPARIALPWTENEVKKIFEKLLTEYNAIMEKFTMGTGGGSGAPENYSDWWVRPDETVVGYIQQPAKFYLTILFMLDKQFKWLLTTEKESLPARCMIDDRTSTIDFPDPAFGNDDDDDNFQLRRLHSPTSSATATTTPAVVSRSSNYVSSSKKQKRIDDALERLNSGRERSHAMAAEVVGIMHRMAASNSSTERKRHELVQDLKESSTLAKETKSELRDLKKKKKRLRSKDKVKNKQKLKRLKKEIKSKEILLDTLLDTTDCQTTVLRKTNAKEAAAVAAEEGGKKADDGSGDDESSDAGESSDESSDEESNDNSDKEE